MRSPARALHPVAWWAWALLVGAAAIRTTNPLLLGLLLAATWFVVACRRTTAPFARSFGAFLKLGAVVLVVRLVLQAVFATRLPGRVLFTLPEVELPDWAAGVSIGGPVTLESLVAATYDSLRLLTLLACVGAANSLASPYRLLRSLPAALHEAGVALTVALSFAPQAVVAAGHVHDARRLRGLPTRGFSAIRGLAMPVLERGLDSSVALAASMDARGYGRRALLGDGRRRVVRGAAVAGLLALGVGCYGLLDAGSPSGLGVPLLVLGGLLVAASIGLGGARSTRTRYRPDPVGWPECATVACGAATLVAFVVAGATGAALDPSVYPLELPTLPLLPALGALVAALPGVLTPEPPS